MFPLSCAHVRAHTGCEMSAHKKIWSTHMCSIQKWFFLIFHTHHSKFRWVQVKCCTKTFMHTPTLKSWREHWS